MKKLFFFLMLVIIGLILGSTTLILLLTNKEQRVNFKINKFTNNIPLEKKIPYVLYQTYKDKSKIPSKVYDNIRLYAKNYKHVIFDDDECIEYLKKNYDNVVVNKFKSLKRGAHKADLFRYCILYKNGGIYADIKTIFTQDIDNIIKDRTKWYTVKCKRDKCIYQGFIATPKGNPIFLKLIKHILNSSDNPRYHAFTSYMYKTIQNNNIVPLELLQEKCNKDCSVKDRYGRCCDIFQKNNEHAFKTRYTDYPW